MRIDFEIDFHGYTAAQMRGWLDQMWASRRWDGLRRIRVIHGQGEVLGAALRAWCVEKGIPWAAERGNPGATILHPARRMTLAASRANLPLARQRRRLLTPRPESERLPLPPQADEQSSGGDALADEFDRLGDLPGGSILREKHSER